VVSSYTPTLSALINAQASPMDPIAHSDGDILVVSLPDVTGLPPLPNAEVEASVVQDLVSAANPSALTGERASISSVLTKLPGVSVFHLACHGHQSQDDPLTSGFSLHDGRLTLEQLMQLHLPSAKLAYLSACETASMDEYQPDEAVNLAATMLFVGFKSVVATMWYVFGRRSEDEAKRHPPGLWTTSTDLSSQRGSTGPSSGTAS
jgi:CHAT domain-containing protein